MGLPIVQHTKPNDMRGYSILAAIVHNFSPLDTYGSVERCALLPPGANMATCNVVMLVVQPAARVASRRNIVPSVST